MAIPGLLSEDEQHAVWLLLLKGASPALACQQLGLSIVAFVHTWKCDPRFFASIQQTIDTLSDNVVASLYRNAIEGNVTAQKLWLEQRPSALWATAISSQAESDEFAHLSNDELAQQLSQDSRDLAAARQRLDAARTV
jgi:hypothetical protein